MVGLARTAAGGVRRRGGAVPGGALRAKSVRDALSDADQAGLAVDGLLVEGAVLGRRRVC
jgi:hypothetical protein